MRDLDGETSKKLKKGEDARISIRIKQKKLRAYSRLEQKHKKGKSTEEGARERRKKKINYGKAKKKTTVCRTHQNSFIYFLDGKGFKGPT